MHPISVQFIPHIAAAQVLDGSSGGDIHCKAAHRSHHLCHRIGDGRVHGHLILIIIVLIVGQEALILFPLAGLGIGPGHIPTKTHTFIAAPLFDGLLQFTDVVAANIGGTVATESDPPLLIYNGHL